MKSTGLFKYAGALAAFRHTTACVSLRHARKPILDTIECDPLPTPVMVVASAQVVNAHGALASAPWRIRTGAYGAALHA